MTNISKGQLWTGRVLSILAILFMLFDSIAKVLKTDVAVEGSVVLGYAEHHVITIGILGLIATILYAVPVTSVLGAILLTGYFGGAVATHIRVDNPLFSHILFPVYIAILMWIGIWLRDEFVRNVFPLKKSS